MQQPAKRGNKSANKKGSITSKLIDEGIITPESLVKSANKKGSITSKLIDEGIITPESLEKLRTAMNHTRSNGN